MGISIDGTITNAGQWESGDVGLSKLGTSQPVWENTGSFEADSLGVNNWTINQSGSWVVNHDMGVSNGSVFNNTGLFDVWGDLGLQATINNHDQMTVGGNLSISGTLHNTCTIYVMTNFSSSGTVTGPSTGCGSIAVDSASTNSGDFGADGSNLDLCDATGGGFDGNAGTLGANVTHCSCTSNCSATALNDVIQELNVQVYPNPFNDKLIVESDASCNIMLRDVHGKIIYSSSNLYAGKTEINLESYANGMYLLEVINDEQRIRRKIVKQ